MELAKVTSKGQITIPIEIRKRLGIKNGDKILFVEEDGRVYMMSSSIEAFKAAQNAFKGEAQKAGLNNEDDVVQMVKDFRQNSR
jgi:AbrB family looped-hinge helix DNA binding protein